MARGDDRHRVHIWLDKEDIRELHLLFDDSPGFSEAIRIIIKRVLRDIRAKRASNAQSIPAAVDFLQERLPADVQAIPNQGKKAG